MVKRKFWVTPVILAAFAAMVFTGCDSPTGNNNYDEIVNGTGLGNGNGQPATFTVTFNNAGGSAVSSQTAAQGGLVQVPSTTRTWVSSAGLWAEPFYIFGGWLHDGELWNFETDTVTADKTLTAH